MATLNVLFNLLCIIAISVAVYNETGIWTALSIGFVSFLLQLVLLSLSTIKERLKNIQDLLQANSLNREVNSQSVNNEDNFSFRRGILTTDEKELAIRGINGDKDSLITFLQKRSTKNKNDFDDVPLPVLIGIAQHICNDAEEVEAAEDEFPDLIDDTPPN